MKGLQIRPAAKVLAMPAFYYGVKSLLTCFLIITSVHSSSASDSIPNRLIDYEGFSKIVNQSGQERQSRRLTEDQFLRAMKEQNVVILDARSESNYRLRHIKGAINLPFTEFTETTLAQIIPRKKSNVLIYCNNNFEGSPKAFASKAPAASLNLSTYTSLKAYGYTNIYELGPLLNTFTTTIPFEGSEIK